MFKEPIKAVSGLNFLKSRNKRQRCFQIEMMTIMLDSKNLWQQGSAKKKFVKRNRSYRSTRVFSLKNYGARHQNLLIWFGGWTALPLILWLIWRMGTFLKACKYDLCLARLAITCRLILALLSDTEIMPEVIEKANRSLHNMAILIIWSNYWPTELSEALSAGSCQTR